MPEPCSPSAVIGNAAKVGDLCHPLLHVTSSDHCCRFMQNRLVESGSATPRLIDDVGRDPIAYEIGCPTFAAIGCGFQARGCVCGSMHHDDSRHSSLFTSRNLELHIHLADGDLVWNGSLIRSV